ncbi:MAG TPA: hypothetical protein VFQ13_18590, partial [Anaerolineales bacterium]|nr:hypothetical protein [Anaerolineales bacterium]
VTSGVPTPKAAGQAESMTVSGLVPGQTYYFAVRAQDEKPNLGDLAVSSPSAMAKMPTPVSAGLYDDRHANWTYSGTWGQITTTGPYLKTFTYTATAGDAAMFTFNGDKLTLYYTQYTNRGTMDVYIDDFDTPVHTINANGSLVWQKNWTSNVLPAGVHTVMVKYRSGGTMLDVDAIQIYGPMLPGMYDERTGWTYTGSWAQGTTNGPYLGTFTYSQAANDFATFSFYGDQVTLYYTQYTNRGQFAIYIDDMNNPVATIDANGALIWQKTWTSDPLTLATHTLMVKHISGTYTDVDAILVGGPIMAGKYDNQHTGWTYAGTWALQSTTNAYEGGFSYTSTPGSTASFTFTGSRFTLYYTQYTNRGEMEVYIDDMNNPVTTINANGALIWQKAWTSNTLTAGGHTVMVKYKSGTMIDVDAILIE